MPHLLAILLTLVQVAFVVGAVAFLVAHSRRTRQTALMWLLAVITRRGLPLASELEALSDALPAVDRGRMNAASGRIRAGATLPEALSSSPGLVSDETLLLAHVGERTGRLGEAFSAEADRLARLREAAVTTTSSPSLALVYLVAVPLIIPVILTALMVFIVPKFKKIFQEFGVSLPPLTEELIASSDHFARYWFLPLATVLPAVMIAGIVFVLSRIYSWNIHLPRWMTPGGRAQRTVLACRALSLAAAAKRPLTDALDPMANVTVNPSDRWRFDRVRERYRGGGSLWEALVAERIISSRDAQLFSAAERAGNLAWTLELVAERVDERRRRRFAIFFEILQPLVVLLLGAAVLFICAAIFMPLVQLIDDLAVPQL